MQCFKLVNGGFVDKVIVFDELPERLIKNIRTREVTGFPRSWARWLASIGSVRDVLQTTTKKIGPGDYEFTYTPIGKEPCFFLLEYQDINQDKEAWRNICEYIRTNVSDSVRLKEKIEDMAIFLAPDPKAQLDIEPEDVMANALIPILKEITVKKSDEELVKHGEQIIVQEPKRRGRPKKEVPAGV